MEETNSFVMGEKVGVRGVLKVFSGECAVIVKLTRFFMKCRRAHSPQNAFKV